MSERKSGKSTSDLMVSVLASAESCHFSFVCMRNAEAACGGRVSTTDSRITYFGLSCALHLPDTPPGLVCCHHFERPPELTRFQTCSCLVRRGIFQRN